MLLSGVILGLAEAGAVAVDAAIGMIGARFADPADTQRAAAIVLALAGAVDLAAWAGAATINIALGAIRDPVSAGRNGSNRAGWSVERRQGLISASVLSVVLIGGLFAPLPLLFVLDPYTC